MIDKEPLNSARAKVALDFAGMPLIIEACLQIIDHIENQPDEKLKHLTFGMLSTVSKASSTDIAQKAISYLSGDVANVLRMQFEFIDNDDIFQIEAAELSEAIRSGEFFHPQSGEIVDNFQKNIYIYFILNKIPASEFNK